MRRIAIAAAMLLAACGSDATNDGNAAQNHAGRVDEANAASSAPDMNKAQEGATNAPETSNGKALPPADAALRFLGQWATNGANCASKAWTFTARALTAASGSKCSFYKVTKVPGGYDIAAECPAKQPDHSDLIKLRFAESARAMLVESNAIPPTGLVYCGK
jgi:hypothetical protein